MITFITIKRYAVIDQFKARLLQSLSPSVVKKNSYNLMKHSLEMKQHEKYKFSNTIALISYPQMSSPYIGLNKHLRILDAVEKFGRLLISLEAKDIFVES